MALSKAPIDITKLDLTSLSDALNKEIITSEDLINLYLDRINEYSDYNAIIRINENAISEAKKLDEVNKDIENLLKKIEEKKTQKYIRNVRLKQLNYC